MNIEKWMAEYCRRIKEAFGDRIRFIGLQGSRARGEANEQSDIDVVCVLDVLTVDDIMRYREALDGIEKRELVCGFLSGWNELQHWDTADLFMFLNDTLPFEGSLEALRDKIDAASVERAARSGAGNIYHGCVHNMVHARDGEVLRSLYKAAAFVLRALAYLRTGKFAHKNNDLLNLLDSEDREILQTLVELKNGAGIDFDEMSEKLFSWSQNHLK